MATLRESPNISSLCSQRRDQITKMRMKRRNQLLGRSNNENSNEFETLETQLLQSENPVLLLQQNASLINTAILYINGDNQQNQLTALRLIHSIVSLQIEECFDIIQSSFPFLIFLIQSNNNEIVSVTSKTISAVCQVSAHYKEVFVSQGIVPVVIQKIGIQLPEITTTTALIQLLSSVTMSNQNSAQLILNSSIPQILMKYLPTTNNTKFISSALLLISLISSNPQFSLICMQQLPFLHYLAVILTTSTHPGMVAPTLTIIGNFFTISTPSQLVPFLTPNVIDSLIRIVQRDRVLMSDAVWVLGNLVSATNFDIVSKVVQSGCLPLLFGLFDSSDDEQLIYSLFVTITNIMASENNGTRPFIKCCLELGLLDYLTDYLKENQNMQFVQLACEILNFLLDFVPDLYQRLERINAIEVLNDLSPHFGQIKYFLDKMSWRR